MFRTQSLDKLSSPDRLDQLLKVVRPQAWVVLLCTGLGLSWAVWWSFTGEIPVTAEGVAILVRPKMVVPVEATVDGRVEEVRYEQGQFVRPWYGTPTAGPPAERSPAELDPAVPEGPLFVLVDPQLESDLRKERALLKFVEERNAELERKEGEYRRRQRRVLLGDDTAQPPLEGQIPRLEERIREFKGLRGGIKELKERFNDLRDSGEPAGDEGQEVEPDAVGDMARQLRESRSQYLVEVEGLIEQGILSQEDGYRIKSQILQLAVESQVFSMRELELDKLQSNVLDWVATLEMRRDDLETVLVGLDLDELQKTQERMTEVGDIQRRIAWLTEQRKQGHVPMPRHHCEQCEAEQQENRGGGELVSLTTSSGEMVRTGDLLARVELWDPHVAFEAVAFLPVASGKKIHFDDDPPEVRVSPTSVEKERHGSLTGRIKVRPSEHPVTVDMAGHVLGDRELAEKLLGDGIYILVEVELDREADSSRLLWTGKRPVLDPTVGTTCEVRVTLEVRRPIDLLFEFFSD